MRGLDADTVDVSSVRRTEIAEETLGRSDLKNAVVTRKETVLRKTELGVLTPADHKGVVLVEGKVASGLRTRNDMQGYTHRLKV